MHMGAFSIIAIVCICMLYMYIIVSGFQTLLLENKAYCGEYKKLTYQQNMDLWLRIMVFVRLSYRNM